MSVHTVQIFSDRCISNMRTPACPGTESSAVCLFDLQDEVARAAASRNFVHHKNHGFRPKVSMEIGTYIAAGIAQPSYHPSQSSPFVAFPSYQPIRPVLHLPDGPKFDVTAPLRRLHAAGHANSGLAICLDIGRSGPNPRRTMGQSSKLFARRNP